MVNFDLRICFQESHVGGIKNEAETDKNPKNIISFSSNVIVECSIVFLDPENIGIDALIFLLSQLLLKLWLKL